MFNALYTLYWPMPVSFDRVPRWAASPLHWRGDHYGQHLALCLQSVQHRAQQTNPGSYTFPVSASAFGIRA
jgi:hypothetical protein